MATQVIMPALGMAQETGRLVNWLKKEGDAVVKGEMLMEIETDKSVVELEAPASGILTHVTPASDEDIPVGETIALIVGPGEKTPDTTVRTRAPDPSAKPSAEGAAASTQRAPKKETERRPASPAARRLARERGIDLHALSGTGPEGAVIARDVTAAGGEAEAATVRTVPLSTMRRVIGERMAESKQSAPHFYVSMDVDMSGVVQERAAWRSQDAGAREEVPSLNDFILYAVAQALKESPLLNATLAPHGIQVFSNINLGFAVAIEEGLVVPVIRNADRLDLEQLAQQSRALADKAQRKRLTPPDTREGTFTVSNLGMLGVDSFVAIINPPQCAILAVGQVTPRVVPHGEGIAIRSIMTMTLSADHRIVDGAIAARFLQGVKQRLVDPRPSSGSSVRRGRQASKRTSG